MLDSLIKYLGDNWGGVVIALTIISIFVDISKIKINPWKAIFKFIGNAMFGDIRKQILVINDKLDNLEKKQDNVEKQLDNMEVSAIRSQILEFANSAMHDRRHTKEEFDRILDMYRNYETIVETKNIPNGQLNQAMKFINDLYYQCMKEDSFLK